MLAIAAHGFDTRYETFIRAHVAGIAPGRTVLLSDTAALTLTEPLHVLRGASLAARMLPSLRRRFHRLVAGEAAPTILPLSRPAVTEAAAFLRTHGVEAVMAEFGPMGVRIAPVADAAGARLFVHFHGADATSLPRHPEIARAYRDLFGRVAGIVAPSAFLAGRLVALGCPEALVHVCPCGVNVPPASEHAHEPGRVIAVGRFVAKKAPHHTIAAFASATSRTPRAKLTILGDGPLLEACRAQTAALGLGDRIALPGALSHSATLEALSTASVFAQHSVTEPGGDMEGLPVAILEAMAASLPVVATRHSGIPEAVVDGETGFLVEEHHVDGMAEALVKLLDDGELRQRMGEAGRARVETHFTHRASCARLRRIMSLG